MNDDDFFKQFNYVFCKFGSFILINKFENLKGYQRPDLKVCYCYDCISKQLCWSSHGK